MRSLWIKEISLMAVLALVLSPAAFSQTGDYEVRTAETEEFETGDTAVRETNLEPHTDSAGAGIGEPNDPPGQQALLGEPPVDQFGQGNEAGSDDMNPPSAQSTETGSGPSGTSAAGGDLQAPEYR